MIGAPKIRLRGRPKGSVVWYGSGVITPPGPPTDIIWTGSHSVPENATPGTVIGDALTVIGGVGSNTLSMTVTAGGRFGIAGSNIVVAGALDYETATSHNVTIRATDTSLNVYNEVFTITVTDVVIPVTDIAWAGSHTVPEDSGIGTVVGGLLSHTGGEGTVTYSLTDTAGGKFSYDGTNIKVAAALDYETATSHNITIRATDTVTGTYDEVFTIAVSDISEGSPITDLNWSGDHEVEENAVIGTVVGGVLSSVGGVPPYTYSLTDSAGGKFAVSGTSIVTAATGFDPDVDPVLSITIKTTDSALNTYEDNFAIEVIEVVLVAHKATGSYSSYGLHPTETLLTVPAGTVAGDFLLAFLAQGGSTLPVAATPSAGWTLLPVGDSSTGAAGFFVRYSVYYRVASGSEPAGYDWFHDSCTTCGVIISYTGVDTANPFGLASTKNTGTGVTATALGVTTTSPDTFIVFTEQDWGNDTINCTPPSAMPNERVDAVILYISDGIVAAVGATGNISHVTNSSSTDPWNAFLIPLKRAATV